MQQQKTVSQADLARPQSRENTSFYRLLLCVFFLFTVLGLLFPFTHDDWAWGTQIGLDRLAALFRNYNGRYVSNLLVIVLTRSRILRALSYGLCFTSIFYFGGRMVRQDRKDLSPLVMVLALVLCMPKTMFAQSVAWTSGYANYAASVGLLLPLAYKVHSILFAAQAKKDSIWAMAGWSLLCFAGQLFAEHITLYVVLLLLVANAIQWRREKRPHTLLAILLAFAILGAGLMFLNGAYTAAASTPDSYQQLPQSGVLSYVKAAAKAYFDNIYALTLLDNLVLTLALSVLSIGVLLKSKASFRVAPSVLIGFMGFYQIVRKWLPLSAAATMAGRIWEGLFCLLYLACVVYALWQDKSLRWKGLFWLLSALALDAPLLVASPIGPRNYFVIYLFLAFLCAQMLSWLLARQESAAPALLRGGLSALCVGCALFYVGIFGYVCWADSARVADVHGQVAQGQHEVYVQRLPFEAYMHGSSPQSSVFIARFKLFYDVPGETSLYLIEP